jgi:hypothetical protein
MLVLLLLIRQAKLLDVGGIVNDTVNMRTPNHISRPLSLSLSFPLSLSLSLSL